MENCSRSKEQQAIDAAIAFDEEQLKRQSALREAILSQFGDELEELNLGLRLTRGWNDLNDIEIPDPFKTKSLLKPSLPYLPLDNQTAFYIRPPFDTVEPVNKSPTNVPPCWTPSPSPKQNVNGDGTLTFSACSSALNTQYVESEHSYYLSKSIELGDHSREQMVFFRMNLEWKLDFQWELKKSGGLFVSNSYCYWYATVAYWIYDVVNSVRTHVLNEGVLFEHGSVTGTEASLGFITLNGKRQHTRDSVEPVGKKSLVLGRGTKRYLCVVLVSVRCGSSLANGSIVSQFKLS